MVRLHLVDHVRRAYERQPDLSLRQQEDILAVIGKAGKMRPELFSFYGGLDHGAKYILTREIKKEATGGVLRRPATVRRSSCGITSS